MTNLAQEARDKAQELWPGASVHSRGLGWIKHQHPTDENKFILDSHVGPIHYGAGDDQEIDTAWQPGVSPQDDPWLWKMTSAVFNVYAGPGTTDFNAGQIVRYVHPFSGEDITFEAQQLQWINDLGQIEVIADPQQIEHTSIDDDTIHWQGAYGPGLDFRWQAQTARMAKYLTIQNLAAIGSPPQFIIDGGNPVLRMPFIFQKSSDLDIYIDGVLWNEKSNNPQTTSGDVEFRLDGESLWWFKKAVVEDASGNNSQFIQQRFRAQAQNLFVEILVPWSWLAAAVYPVTIDPTVDPQVAASADDASEDGGTVSITSPSMFVNTTTKYVGARWVVSVANGATIDVSYASYYSLNANRPVDYTMSVEDEDTAAVFTTGSSDISGRTPHATTVDWDNGSVDAGADEWIDSDSLNTPIEGVIGRGGWSSGNYLCTFYTERSGGAAGMVARLYDGGSSEAPKLHIEYTAAGGTEYQQAAAGTLTSSGTIIKQTAVSYAGALTSAGTLATLGTFFRALAGTLTSAGTVVKDTAKSYAGTLTSASTLATSLTFLRSFAGTLTSSGAIAKQTNTSYAGALTSSGTVQTVKSFVRAFVGTLTSSGTLAKETATSLAGTLTSSGVVTTIKTVLLSLAGTLTSSGTLVKDTAVSYVGTLTSAGTVEKETAVSYTGSLTSSGSLVRKTITSLAGTLTSAGDLATQFIGGAGEFFQSLAGTLTSSSNLTKRTSVSYDGTLVSSGNIVKSVATSLAGTLTSAGDVALLRAKLLAGMLTSSGAITKQTARSLAGTLTSAGTIAKGMALSLAGTLSSSGIVSSILNVTVVYRALTVKARSFSLTVQERSSSLVLKSRDFLLTVIDRGFE